MPELDLAINNARYLVTCNSSGEVFENYSIGIRAGEIVEISKSQLNGAINYDASGKLIAPGLVNTHTHLAMTLLRGYAEGVDLQGFLERVWAAEGAIMDGSTAELGTKLGALEALLSGTTTTLDMYLFPEDTHRGAVAAGLRHVAGPIFFDFPGLDGMEWSARIEFAKSWPDKLGKIGGPKVPIYLMPHATYTCSPDHLTEIAALANEINANIHIHGSNLKLASGIADITKYLKHGITVALGTDGCSSSNDLDMWPVMRLAGYLIAQNSGPQNLDAERIFRMATIEGARALGMADSIGSLEVGKRADIIAVELNTPHLIPIHNLFAQLVFAAGRSDVSDVFVDGEQVVEDYRSTKLDFSQIQKDVTNRIAQL